MFTVYTRREGRSFAATCLAYVSEGSHKFVDPSPKGHARPVFFVFACPAAVYKPFTANIALGEPVFKDETHAFEFLRRAGYKLYPQEIGGLVIGTYLLEEAFEVEPRNPFPADEHDEEAVADDKDAEPKKGKAERAPQPVCFYMMPAQSELEANTATLDVARVMGHAIKVSKSLPYPIGDERLRHVPALALLWSAYVSHRVNAPIIQEPEFIAQAFCAAVYHQLVVSVPAPGVARLGYVEPWFCRTSDTTIRELLAQEIERYQRVKTEGYTETNGEA